ncbi:MULTISPECIES: flavin reductase family protein [Streptomyces]|uniref:Flavin reductase (DIM6/NTAB) family NADH-FMN oxidoreductase RutF n=1 Tax=Streptomyces clavifer TaxID=68188 RepID=A0ABS4V3A5_9ACTN|nr:MULTISPECIES: flavin reductase family protein [Streptomyces]KQX80556.1 flavin reductase [Streptomyces sp. Root1319]KQZ19674.1 flavin reductase [Streptomyces sp. Root55]MBP2358395.1 flavin reductase (DIM6/NTAB) family NADH-FMN oxidoreductase RutF [Streptomyces clavifer]MDX2741949.1 flavin reductase family protein [Streptomyces sp. NRRL_B-2557]MDX3065462.1 flavin reductase family protein [Streptomyces sp. ND04-05B]
MSATSLLTASAAPRTAAASVLDPEESGTVMSRNIPADEFRAAMASLAAPVTVVTCYDDTGTPRGLTASAVSSLSLDPPLILVCLDRGSRTHDVLTGATAFTVHLLGPENEVLARKFAGPTDQRFENVPLATGPTSHHAPQLADSALRLTCARHDVIEAGDHTILVGRVAASDCLGRPAGGLVWHHRGFAHARPVEAR